MTATARPPGVRLEIQSLRALAVGIVVLYHLWPDRLPGGFVGVDVFFVVSGFLITGHLVREVETTGTVRLSRFWARRARRLLPASLLVLAVSLAGIALVVPESSWQQFFREVTASALYVQNWVLAADSIDYLAAENLASPVQHFWSLSVEEQFYLIWPLLLLVTALVTRRAGSGRRRATAIGVLGLVAGASLAFSVVFTAASPGEAYFVTPTRAWEFAAGGLLALAGTAGDRVPTTVRVVASWVGWAAIVATAFTFSGSIPFPSFTALLPVLAAVAVIWAGSPRSPFSPTRALTVRPIVFVGDVSYSIYLWHWPLLVLVPFAIGRELDIPGKIAVLAATVLLAWLTTRFVEDPVRRSTVLSVRSRRTLVASLVAMALVVGPALIGSAVIGQRIQQEADRAAELADSPPECFGAASLDPALDCAGAAFDTLTPSPATAAEDRPVVYENGCYTSELASSEVASCVAGDTQGTVRVALIGDSHAAQWYSALEKIAVDEGWQLVPFLKSSCLMSAESLAVEQDAPARACARWNDTLASELAGGEPFDLVIVGHSATNADPSRPDIVDRTMVLDSIRSSWQPLIDRGSHIVVLRDTPRTADNTTECLERNLDDTAECDVPRDGAVIEPDMMAEAAVGIPAATVVDLNDRICTATVCPSVIGGVVVYRDTHHLTATYVSTLAPYLEPELRGALAN